MPVVDAPGPAAGAATFAKDVTPLLARSCAGCHTATGPGSRQLVIFDGDGKVQHGTVAKDVVRVIAQTQAGTMPRGANAKLTAAEVATLKAWQTAGSPNN